MSCIGVRKRNKKERVKDKSLNGESMKLDLTCTTLSNGVFAFALLV